MRSLNPKLSDNGIVFAFGTVAIVVISVFLAFLFGIVSQPGEDAVIAYSQHAHLAHSKLHLEKSLIQIDALMRRIQELAKDRVDAGEVALILFENCDREITTDLVIRLAYRESRWNPSAKGLAGEIGLMQIKPSSVGIPEKLLFMPAVNIYEGIKYLKKLRAEYGSFALGLAHYAEGYTVGKTYAQTLLRGDK